MPFENYPHVAGGDIRPARFVKPSTAANSTVLEADANEQVVGVSQDGSRLAPIPSETALLAGIAGSPISVHPIGSYALVEVGSGGVTRGANVKSDADGKAVLAATTGTTMQWIAGQAMESASEGEFVHVLVNPLPHYPALT